MREILLQKRVTSLHSILQDGKQIRIGLHRFGADFQEEFIPHLLLIAVASNFSSGRETHQEWIVLLPRNPLVYRQKVEGSFVRSSWKHEPLTSTLTEAPEFTTPGGQGFFFLWMCKRIQMRKWVVLEFTRFLLCNFVYIDSNSFNIQSRDGGSHF